jgi:thiamine kinase-like enzyme
MISIKQVIGKIPEWGNESIQVTKLEGGITNENYRVDVGNESFVVRIPGEDSHFLGIDREREYECNVAASHTGIAPEVAHFLRAEGVLITRFVQGQIMSVERMGHEDSIRKAVRAIRKVHNSSSFPGIFSVFRTIEDYLKVGKTFGVPLPDNIGWMFEKAYEIERATVRHPEVSVPCHNDLLTGNFVDDGTTFWIIDWELAAMGDRYFDLGNFSINHLFGNEQDEIVTQEYFGKVSLYELSRIKLFKALSDLREGMWAVVQMGVSKLGVDFKAYRDKHFERYCMSLKDPEYHKWIDKVSS